MSTGAAVSIGLAGAGGEPESQQRDAAAVPGIAGLAELKGVILYGATLTFAGLYIYFIVEISAAMGGPPPLDATLVSSAAALAGVLGSAFALEVGTATRSTNRELDAALSNAGTRPQKTIVALRQLVSLEPSTTNAPSWPKTFGIWAYAIIAASVSLTYLLNQNQTPGTIKTLAVAFGGYVIALVTAAYKS